ncbi:hypothetical protein N0V93_003124 [Gnomoniopsis smithogilvyi]|uniref:Uncharacterized protein n=1 Tax=Gnomoniopsis smithogilvyi TaxID=1191159 RepID=A0A9W8YZV6_9PEZI|nr:hypothetical protein N0V93_003124 [Gnomoniopsis smithogilvyi]
MLDSTKGCRDYMVALTFRFDDVLSAEGLRDSLEKLLAIGDWKKLGGRLQINKTGRLELHVPEHFTPDRPAITFSHEDLFSNTSIKTHPIARKLPEATNEPSIQAIDTELQSLATRADVPTTLEEMIERNAPQLSLHITSFSDATLVGLAWSHTLMDAIGLEQLLRSWSLVIAGREADVPPVLGAGADVMWEIAGDADAFGVAENEALQSHVLLGWNKIKFLLRYAWDAFWTGQAQRRQICLPKTALAQLRQAVEEESAKSSGIDEKAFVSDSDILTAWLARLIAKSEVRARPLTIASAVNARFRLAKRLDPTPGVYIQNMVFVAFTFMSPEAARGPLRPIAEAHRSHLAAQSTEEHMLGFLQHLRRQRDVGQDVVAPLYGRPDSIAVTVNNLTKVNMMKAADFAPGVVQQGEERSTRSSAIGAMTYYHLQPLKNRIWMRNHFVVLGKDHNENCWIVGTLTPGVWAVAQNEIETMHIKHSL